VARRKSCSAIVLSGAIEPSREVLEEGLPKLVASGVAPVLVGGLSSVYACEAIARTGAEAIGRDIEQGLRRINELLGKD